MAFAELVLRACGKSRTTAQSYSEGHDRLRPAVRSWNGVSDYVRGKLEVAERFNVFVDRSMGCSHCRSGVVAIKIHEIPKPLM